MRNRGCLVWLAILTLGLFFSNMPPRLSGPLKAAGRNAMAPLQQTWGGASERVREALAVFRGIGGLIRANREMAEEMVVLRSQVRHLEGLEAENILLREQLHFAQRSMRRLIPCEVIGREVSGWWRTVRVAGGARNGIFDERAVITTDGLVGKTREVTAHTTEVLLISDPTCSVSAKIARTGAHGILKGTGLPFAGHPLTRLEYINKDISVREGDEVLTSGLGGVYPRGLLIGYVERVYRDESGLYQTADVIPRADLGRLHYVFVVSEDDPLLRNLARTPGPLEARRQEEAEP